METAIYRQARSEDLDDIIYNWSLCFPDPEALPRSLLPRRELPERAIVAECSGAAVCSALLYPAIDFAGVKLCYLYALCTRPGFAGRGLATGLLSYASERSLHLGCDLLILRPGDASLEGWYRRLGYEPLCLFREKKLEIGAVPAAPCDILSPEEFYLSLPASAPLTMELAEAQACLLRLFGGCFMRSEGRLLCVEDREDHALIRYDSGPGELPASAAAAAARALSRSDLRLLCPGGENAPHALLGLPLRSGLPPLPQPLFFPFTLD